MTAVAKGTPVAVAVTPGGTVGLAWPGGSQTAGDPAAMLAALDRLEPRWVWWSAAGTATALVTHGLRVRSCWDLGAIGALLHGLRRDDPAAVWAAGHDLPPPARRDGELDLFDASTGDAGPVGSDDQLDPQWVKGAWHDEPDGAERWARLALELQQRQAQALRDLPDPRRSPSTQPLALLTAHAESAAALLCIELARDGLPIDRAAAGDLLRAAIGDRPVDEQAEHARRAERDAEVLRHFPEDSTADLRSPDQVRALLARVGLDLPDTRSWRLEPHAGSVPGVAALLAWRKADRLATTYGWRWLDTQVGADGRLRGGWSVADGGSGRMTAGAGLHNLPTELRPAVRARPGYRLVGADLGQVEPRVLAVVSGDPALVEAARSADMYAPVAEQLRCDRPTAKVAVLAAMYGQTSGAAGAALRDMERVYPQALRYLRDAETAARERRDLRTYGGRLIRFGSDPPPPDVVEPPVVTAARGRYGRNAAIQGPAAELFKAWAATVRAGLADTGGQIVLCLHDELLLHVPEADVATARGVLQDGLDATVRWWAAGSAVRFVADVGDGESWAETH